MMEPASQPPSQPQQLEAPAEPDVAAGALGQTEVTSGRQVELDHSIGFSGSVVDAVHLHPSVREYLLIVGSSIVVRNLQDPHDQHFLTAHDDAITCLSISNNGNLLASGQRGENSDIVVWDFAHKKAIYRLSEHDHEVSNLAFSHDDRLLLSTGNTLDGKMFIWNMANGHIVAQMPLVPSVFAEAPKCVAWGGMVKDVKLRLTTNYQFAVSGAKKMTLWQLVPSTGQLLSEIINTGTHVRDYICMTFSKNQEDYLIAGTASGDVCGFHVKSKQLVFCLNLCALGVRTIQAITVDRFIAGGGDGQVFQVTLNGRNSAVATKTQFYGAIHGLTSSPDGLQSLVATEKGYLYRLRNQDFSQMLLCENHTQPVTNSWFMPGVSDRFITCSEDGTVRLWDSNSYAVTARCVAQSSQNAPGQGGVFPLCAIFTDEVIISGWNDGRIRAYRVDNSQLLWQIDNAHKGGVTSVCLAASCKFVCSGGMEGEVRVWEIRSRELISHLKEHTSRVTKIQLFPDDQHLLTCARDKSILCWDLKVEKRLSAQTQRMGGLNAFAIAPLDNNKYISVGQEKKITYWDLRKANPEAILESSPYRGETDELSAVAISNSNKYFAVGGQAGVVRIYDFSAGRFIIDCKAHSRPITSICFSSDDRQIISTGRDGLIAIWNVFLQ